MNSFFKLSSFLFLLVILSSCHSTAQKKEDYKKSIDSLIQNADPLFNGVVLISQKGKTLYSKAKGYSDFDSKKVIKPESQFEIMSNSKQITAVLILLEVEKGKIDLQSPIKKYLPHLKQTWADSVTVHQLLNHTHGIVDLEKPLIFKPGTDFKYGNLSFNLLGEIAAFSAQKNVSALQNELFQKLEMKNTFSFDKSKTPNLVSGYFNENNVLEKVTQSQITPQSLGADGVVSTASDLVIWNNKLHNGKILKPETYQLMIKYNVLSQHNVFGKDKKGYGYGIRVIDNEPIKYLGHTGLGDGFSSLNLYFPDSGISLIILENQMNAKSDLFYASEIKIKDILMKSRLLTSKP